MLRCLQDLQEGPCGDDGDAGVFAQGKDMGVAGHNVVRVALHRTGQDHVSAGSAGMASTWSVPGVISVSSTSRRSNSASSLPDSRIRARRRG